MNRDRLACCALLLAVCGFSAACGGVDVEHFDGDDDGSGGAGTTTVATTAIGPSAVTGVGVTTTAVGSSVDASTGAGASGSTSSGDGGAGGGGPVACDLVCGSEERCDGVHLGIDDDCDGSVDEACPCTPGTSSRCFIGDPTSLDGDDCFQGTMVCGDDAAWGACLGGQHPDDGGACVEDAPTGCHGISAVPLAPVDLTEGLGDFDDGSGTWSVDCPVRVSPCPVASASSFTGLQAGRYEVTYTRDDGDECSFPLDVAARGLRVELAWAYGPTGAADLDLHLLQPNTLAMMDASGSSTDCTWDTCRIDNGFPEWFPQRAPLGDPVAWYLDPVTEQNSCFFAPRGSGAQWATNGRGCHNARLDVDTITCNPAVTDPGASDFCTPESVAVDFPPLEQWMRLGVVHYSGGNAQPVLKVFCDGALRATLGPEGFNAPVVTNSGGGFGDQQGWLAADVAFVADGCGGRRCEVVPIYADPNARTPWIQPTPTTGPAFPPLPTP